MHKCDYHIHTSFSDGKDSVEQVIEAAIKANVSSIAITDHFDPNDFRPKISCITEDELLEHFQHIKRAAENKNIKVLCGIETTPERNGKLALSDKVFSECEVIITSCHYIQYSGSITTGEFYNDDYWNTFKEIMLAMALGKGLILGHCEDYLPIEKMIHGLDTTFKERREICKNIADRYFDRDYIVKLTENLLKSGKFCELHCNTQTPREWVIRYMAEKGVVFSPGSDAHMAEYVGQTKWAYDEITRTGGKMCSL